MQLLDTALPWKHFLDLIWDMSTTSFDWEKRQLKFYRNIIWGLGIAIWGAQIEVAAQIVPHKGTKARGF